MFNFNNNFFFNFGVIFTLNFADELLFLENTKILENFYG